MTGRTGREDKSMDGVMRAGFDIPAADERSKEVDSGFVGVSESDNDDIAAYTVSRTAVS